MSQPHPAPGAAELGEHESADFVELSTDQPIWDRFFIPAPLVLIGTADVEHGHNLAVKHMAGPMGWSNLFGFVCAPAHRTYTNIVRHEAFTVGYAGLDHIVATSLSAAPRSESGEKPALDLIPVEEARRVPGVVPALAEIQLECRLARIVDDLDSNSLIIGKVVAARIRSERLRRADVDDSDLISEHPVLVYLAPGRIAEVDESLSFPYHEGWSR